MEFGHTIIIRIANHKIIINNKLYQHVQFKIRYVYVQKLLYMYKSSEVIYVRFLKSIQIV